MSVDVDYENKTLKVRQEITFYNQSQDTLNNIILNDWNNAYSGKDTPLAKRFSDEFIRSFHLAKKAERGNTDISIIIDQNNRALDWKRLEKQPDLVRVQLKNPIYPNRKFTIKLRYVVKIPSDKFTKFGYNDDNKSFNLRNWYLAPARLNSDGFALYSNENLDDIANSISDYKLSLTVPNDIIITTDLNEQNKVNKETTTNYSFTGKQLNNFSLSLEKSKKFEVYRNAATEVSINLKENKVTDIHKTLLIDHIITFVANKLGNIPNKKVMVTQVDYDRNPVYGLNQLPAFLRPFSDSFLFEMQFLKTYLNANLKSTLKLDPRKNAWIYDAIQMHIMMQYVDEFHSDKKMMGKLSDWRLLKNHHIFDLSFNDKYNYLYLLMARKNLDQPIGASKDELIKFNEQIAGKYRAGLSIKYLDSYLNDNTVSQSIKEFYLLNTKKRTNRDDFEQLLKSNTDKDISWFFNTIVDTRDIIDYKFKRVIVKNDSLQISIKNRTGTNTPIPLYGIKNDTVVFKKWLKNVKVDTTLTIASGGAERLALNYNNEVPEYNLRNNWKKVGSWLPNQKPFKFTFLKDIENPKYNQVFYVPSFIFNLYDGFSPGLRLNNKSMLPKPLVFNINPTYSLKKGTLIGSFSVVYNNFIRDQELYHVKYSILGSTFHYAPDARYIKFVPAVQFRIREDDFRQNKKQFITLRQVMVEREQSNYVTTDKQNENYSVFNARYSKYESEITKHYNFVTDVQVANSFGKVSGEIQFRKLFNDNRQINIRFFAGAFMYRSTSSEFFSFGLDRPTDYMFDYNLYGRSEATGLFSQQYVMAEGGFKSIFKTRYANQWMTTVNGSFNIWNWVEVYGDAGMFKNQYRKTKFVYDSGIRLNMLPDYFELYFPVYSSNGFELNDNNYGQKIRFVVTIRPKTLISLFTRKWF
ncbi:MAG: aminopeptidase [Flavobacterium sp. MedPE-SWcel]|uniref:aminopeptidase n=1 Tax=uncultured Flavobacterium sp. TaxID=165435 RepID=UPI00091CDFD4|nr:aminopeptidase [uncultured Flavobacterium sp.]OIQ22458.1 MAG: aminopeptidase [Flavobacterium sp. MedPE-SWcel]